MKVLIDRNIELNARTHMSILVPKSFQWGDTTVTCDVLQRAACPPRPDETFRSEQIPYLVSICQLAKTDAITLYTAQELSMERWRQKGHDEGYVGLNWLRGVKLEHANSPADRVIVIDPFRGSIGLTENEQMQFFDSIRDARFLHIRQSLGNTQIDDAFHLWTAEINGLNAFLTMDQKFWNNVTRVRKKIDSPVAVLTPKELCLYLNAAPADIEKLAAEHLPFC